jgi:hypothetical protein
MVKLMKKLILYVFLASAFLFVTCDDPVFYNISQEEKLLEPKIQGSPTNFAFFNGNMYVASGQHLYKYNGTHPSHSDRGVWNEITPSSGGRIFELASTNNYLYVLFKEESSRGVLGTFDGIIWDELPGSAIHNIRSIHSIDNKLFIGAGEKIDALYILYYDYVGKELRKLRDTGSNLLNGAAYADGIYYLSTKDLVHTAGGDIYHSSDLNSENSAAPSGHNKPFLGIINFNENTIYAIDQDGRLYNVLNYNDGGFANMGSYPATGALSVWENEDGKRLLLAGRKDIMSASTTSGYTYGYLELNGNIFNEPGLNDISTVNYGENGKYRSTIGKYPVSHIIQFPTPESINGKRLIFASTQKNGVWSYRERDGNWYWNAEQ